MSESEHRPPPPTKPESKRAVWVAALLCTALPIAARSALNDRVQGPLSEAASRYLGVDVELGSASVGLTGTLEIDKVHVAHEFRADRVVAAVVPTGFGATQLGGNELLVEGARGAIRIDSEGDSNLARIVRKRRRSAAIAGSKGQGSGARGRPLRLRLAKGAFEIEIEDHGRLGVGKLDAVAEEGTLHAVLGDIDVELHDQGWGATGTLPRIGIDADLRRGELQRLLADGGQLRISGPGGQSELQHLFVAHGVEEDTTELSALTRSRNHEGWMQLRREETLGGDDWLLRGEDLPLALLGPWLPEAVKRPSQSYVSGQLVAKRREDIQLQLIGNARALSLLMPSLSRKRVDSDVNIDASALLRRTDDGLYVEAAIDELAVDKLVLHGEASGEWTPDSRLPQRSRLHLVLDRVACADALSSLPQPLRESLAGLELRGAFESSIELQLDRQEGRHTRLDVAPGLQACRVAKEPPSADTKNLRRSHEHRTPDGRLRLLAKGAEDFVELDELPDYVYRAFVSAEDGSFFRHRGLDEHQIERSLAINMERGKLVRGGSTISQQLVKNLFLHRGRSFSRKLQEAVLTWRLEKNLSKRRILELYLNIIELGDEHTYGLAEASRRWFGIEPTDLSIAQAAFLAAMTPEPTTMSRRIREAGGIDPISAGRVQTILRVMKRDRVISSRDYRKASEEELAFSSRAMARAGDSQGAKIASPQL